MLSAPRFVLYLSADTVELWRRRGRALDRVSSLDPARADYVATLRRLLVAQRAHAVGLLVHLPNLMFQSEQLPTLSKLDRRKFIARRLDYVYPQMLLRGARNVGRATAARLLLAGVRNDPLLSRTVNAIVATKASLSWIAHTGLEAMRILAAERAAPVIAVMRIGNGGLLLAGQNGVPLASRLLSPAQLQADALAKEISSTYSYLQRHGWQQERDLAGLSFGVELPQDLSIFSRRVISLTVDAKAELLAQSALSLRPWLSLSQPRLVRLSLVRLLQKTLQVGAITAAMLAIGSFGTTWLAFKSVRQADTELTERMTRLPPPLPVQDSAILNQLRDGLDAPLAIAAALPNDNIQGLAYQGGELGKANAMMLRVLAAEPLPLAGWQLKQQPGLRAVSGTFGKQAPSSLVSYTYRYTGQP